ncbi:MAG: sodium ion-translocating decarboxylase subunit beta [Ruminococcaceae bacterium]|nr:sodium ion-translocating decarboxylase subunit beta [Oscillospiraceae bacterium]
MNFTDFIQSIFGNVANLKIEQVIMWIIGGLLIFLAIKKDMEPTLLLPMGFGAILVNLPMSGAITQIHEGLEEIGVIDLLFDSGIANELFPLLLFIGIGAMIDFEPVLSNPKLMLFGAAAQFGIFFTLSMATLIGFDIKDAASIAIIGAADGPTSIFVANFFESKYIGAIIVAAYSYMALVPIVQPPVIKLLTTRKERLIRMDYAKSGVSKVTKILFPIIVTMITGIVSPRSVALIGFLMFGNLLRECGVLDSLSETAQKVLANLITLLLGITVASKMTAEAFLDVTTLMILGLGLVAFIFDTVGGVLFAKLLNLFSKKKINPMIGAAGISAFPMSARVVHKIGLQEDNQNFLLMHAVGANVSGQIASVVAGGLILNFFG